MSEYYKVPQDEVIQPNERGGVNFLDIFDIDIIKAELNSSDRKKESEEIEKLESHLSQNLSILSEPNENLIRSPYFIKLTRTEGLRESVINALRRKFNVVEKVGQDHAS